MSYADDYFDNIAVNDQGQLWQVITTQRALSLTAVNQQFQSLLSVNECQLWVHLVVDGLVAVLVQPRFHSDHEYNTLLYSLCEQELARIVTLFNNKSPLVQLQFPLSLFRFDPKLNDQMMWMANDNVKTISSASSQYSHFCTNIIVVMVVIQASFRVFRSYQIIY